MALKGVNLGGWLVLERWITPSVFEGLTAQDEYSFCLESGEEKTSRLSAHRQRFITEQDFAWLANAGINSVRIPVPHWLFGDEEPYVGMARLLDQAMEWAERYGLAVVLDVHTAPGSQNGRMHSGRAGEIGWHKNPANLGRSLDFLDRLSSRYGQADNLFGIELLNEPRAWISPAVLKDYYQDGYHIVRANCRPDAAVIISDYFAPWRWGGFMREPAYSDVFRDTHLYQCHRASDKKLTAKRHINKAAATWLQLVHNMQKTHPLLVGEWSLALAPETFAGMSQPSETEAIKAYGEAQLSTFGTTFGWFYWTYKTENKSLWNFRHCVEQGWLKL